ncbi:hypothetical protein AC578_5720 [Pseudocercospora eumusae]|uniref:Uncharacterized protein n=1 Tax=Pseudocercospora eumusae TaxID=321146 RepID=A0A139HES3_9PEZI|nr:hypothetical protein AC578_5720 [Pseudocercospora eumusae]
MSETPKGWDYFCNCGTGREISASTKCHSVFPSSSCSRPTQREPQKGIVHSQGGLIVNGMKEHKLHYNHDEIALHDHYAGIGWTLWDIMIGALLVGTPIVENITSGPEAKL